MTPLPATVDTVVLFLVEQARTLTRRGTPKTLATIQRYRATISKAHKRARLPSPAYDPLVREVVAGIVDEKGAAPLYAKEAATADVLDRMLAPSDGRTDLVALRERAILLVGAVTGMRRAELSALNLGDLARRDWGISIAIRRSKTDQEGVGRYVAVTKVENPSRCAVRALDAWVDRMLELDARPAVEGRWGGVAEKDRPLFQSARKNGALRGRRLLPDAIAEIVKGAALRAGLDPKLFAGHSLRAGYVTQGRREGMAFVEIMEQTGHRKIETVRRYARDATDPFVTGRAGVVAEAFARGGKKKA